MFIAFDLIPPSESHYWPDFIHIAAISLILASWKVLPLWLFIVTQPIKSTVLPFPAKRGCNPPPR